MIEETDIEIFLPDSHFKEWTPRAEKNDSEGVAEVGQRTEEWQEQRKGNWTGSQIKELMSCNSKGGRKSWIDPSKVHDFGETSIKYIFQNAMERKTGRYLEGATTKEMLYGTNVEGWAFRRAEEFFHKKGLFLKKVGFKQFGEIPTAGASADGVAQTIKEEVKATIEIKCCTSWGTYYDRTFDFLDEKGKDFWQTQTQMEAWGVDLTYYIVISPPKDFRKYLKVLYLQGNDSEAFEQLYEEWLNETEIHIQEVKKSPIHVDCLMQRIEIAESTISEFLETGKNIRDILYSKIDFSKDVSKYVETEESPLNQEEINEINVVDEVLVLGQEEEKKQVNFDEIEEDLPF